MRLICTDTGQFIEIHDHTTVEYAILSHTWNLDGEQAYQKIREIQSTLDLPVLSESSVPNIPFPFTDANDKASSAKSASSPSISVSILHDPELGVSEKVRRACAAARAHGYRFLWIDSCCIDKTSSSELSEAINSMFVWYRDAGVCYAYLSGVPNDDDPYSDGSEFSQCRWFKRGWTLQELIAPRIVVFLSDDWEVFGTKTRLARAIQKVTNIDRLILTHQQRLDEVSVATRMSWASTRSTSRVEDQAYSLLGIFDIHLPILYGERENAFLRLQEEILTQIPDQSIFLWGTVDPRPDWPVHLPIPIRYKSDNNPPLLAPSPTCFRNPVKAKSVPYHEFAKHLPVDLQHCTYPTPSFTALGLQTQFPLIASKTFFPQLPRGTLHAQFDGIDTCYLAVLSCQPSDKKGSFFALLCHISPAQPDRVSVVGASFRGRSLTSTPQMVRVVLLPASLLAQSERMQTIYTASKTIARPRRINAPRTEPDRLCLTPGSESAFERAGYDLIFTEEEDKFYSFSLVLSKVAEPYTTAMIIFVSNSPHNPSLYRRPLASWDQGFDIRVLPATLDDSAPSLMPMNVRMELNGSIEFMLKFASGLSWLVTCVTTTGPGRAEVQLDLGVEEHEPEPQRASVAGTGVAWQRVHRKVESGGEIFSSSRPSTVTIERLHPIFLLPCLFLLLFLLGALI